MPVSLLKKKKTTLTFDSKVDLCPVGEDLLQSAAGLLSPLGRLLPLLVKVPRS